MRAAVVYVALAAGLAVGLFGCGAGGDNPTDDYDIYKCKAPVTGNLPNGNHNPGMDCQGACHDHGFTLSGTVFEDSTSNAPAVGATVNVRDKTLKTLTMITASNGNFYTMEHFEYPFRVWVSSCPDVELMPDSVDTNTGLGASCNQGICHNNAAGTGVITIRQ
jgi:hypothetical protein